MARPNWEYIRVDVLLPDHPKLDGLSAAAKWTLVEMWCYCGHHLTDGFVRDVAWKRFGTPNIRRLIVENGLVHRVSGGYMMHDYLAHQRSRAEVIDLREKRRKAGEKGGRAKANAVANALASATASAIASATPPDSTHASPMHHRATTDEDSKEFSTGAVLAAASGESPRHGTSGPKQVLKQTASKPLAEAEAEAEVSSGPVGDQSSVRYARDDDLIDLIITELRAATGRTISRQWAEGVRSSLLNGRTVTDPAAYVRNAIRNERDPRTRFLPVASSLPSARPPGEAALAAGVTPNGTPLRGPAVAAIAAEVRQAITQEPA